MVMVSHLAQPSIFAHEGRFLHLIETQNLSKRFGGLGGASAVSSGEQSKMNMLLTDFKGRNYLTENSEMR
jgi:hypothetical protein